MRKLSCSADISMLKIAAGTLWPSAAFSAMLIASVVLPIDGRPAMMMSSPRCKPAVILSISTKPVDTPVISLVEWLKKSSRSMVFGRICFNDTKPEPRRWPALGDLEYALLGAIDDLGCRPPFRRVSARRDVAADLDELAQHRVVAHDAPVGANVGRARRVLDEAREIRQPAGRFELPEALQVLADGDGVGRLVALDERGDRSEDQPMVGAIEILGGDDVGDLVPGALIQHQPAEQATARLRPSAAATAGARSPGGRARRLLRLRPSLILSGPPGAPASLGVIGFGGLDDDRDARR